MDTIVFKKDDDFFIARPNEGIYSEKYLQEHPDDFHDAVRQPAIRIIGLMRQFGKIFEVNPDGILQYGEEYADVRKYLVTTEGSEVKPLGEFVFKKKAEKNVVVSNDWRRTPLIPATDADACKFSLIKRGATTYMVAGALTEPLDLDLILDNEDDLTIEQCKGNQISEVKHLLNAARLLLKMGQVYEYEDGLYRCGENYMDLSNMRIVQDPPIRNYDDTLTVLRMLNDPRRIKEKGFFGKASEEFVVYDIETTGFKRGRDEVLSLAYIIFDGTFSNVLASDVLYFYHDNQPKSNPAALAVHGLTQEYLSQYRDQFDTNLMKAYKLLTKGNLIGHNSIQFDLPFISAFLNTFHFNSIVENRHYDTMQIWRQVSLPDYKLENMPTHLNISPELIESCHKKWFPADRVDTDIRSHDAAYDVTKTALIFLEAVQRGLVKNG